MSVLDATTIGKLPQRDANLSDVVTILPGVQTNETSRSSLSGGEISPPNLSISGGKPYQNNFRIDGIGNNSQIDPLADDPSSATMLPSNPQEVFLAPALVDHITVYDSNIPADYGGFTGGVVDARTLRPKPEISGDLSYRTTRNSWAEQFVTDQDQEDFQNSNTRLRQPRFEKHQVGMTLNIPMTGTMGMVASYQQLFSRITLKNLDQDKAQFRRSENYFLKIGGSPTSDSYLATTLIWAPYAQKLFRPDNLGSDYSIQGGGLRLGCEWEQSLSIGTWHLSGGYRESQVERKAPRNLFAWNANSAIKDWGQLVGSRYSFEGGLGDLTTAQTTGELHTDLAFVPALSGAVIHHAKVGLDAERIQALYDRPETSYSFFPVTALTPTVVCQDGAIDCIDGEQFFSQRQVYAATRLSAHLTLLDAYVEDRAEWGDLELRPGLRASYDDFLENLNFAPRLAAAWKLFGNNATIVVAGVNRYYGQTLVAYKLREAFSPYTPTEVRSLDPTTGVPGSWTQGRAGTSGYKYSDLKTPYNNEWTIGLRQSFLGGALNLNYVNRKGYDEFARERQDADNDGVRFYVLNNNGSSNYKSVRLSWERRWVHHYLLIGATWQELKTDTISYNTDVDLADLEKVVYYNGQYLHLSDLPATDFNRPWVGSLTYVGSFPFGLIFTNITRFQTAYRALGNTGENTSEGYDIYGEIKAPSILTFDWKLSWQIPLWPPSQKLALNLEIFNVFNRHNRVGTSNDEYALGRQFWAGAEYSF